jgi:AcrR family transcriptional regulator
MVEVGACVTIRYPSGEVEHRYGREVPQVGERIGRNGEGGFVTSVEQHSEGHWTVSVGTYAPPEVTWSDASAPPTEPESASARERILEAAYELFSARGIRAVGTEELIERAGVSRATFYRQFASKNDLVLAFLQRREHRWTRAFVETEARRRGSTPREQLLAIFDVFDEWFQRNDFEGCSFINVLLETADLEDPVGRASAEHLEYIRSVVRTLAEEAGIEDAAEFAHSWHILMKGSIVAAGEGDVEAAKRARAMGELVLDHYLSEKVAVEAA